MPILCIPHMHTMVERQATEILQNTTAKRVREELAAVTGLQEWNDRAYWSYFLVPIPESPFPAYYLYLFIERSDGNPGRPVQRN